MADGVNNKKVNRILKSALVLSLILCIAAAVLGFIASLYTSDYATEKSGEVYISSVEDITNAGASIYNDRLYLEKDIHITDSNFRIGSSEAPFIGVFDGQGHTVYLDYTEATANHSMFDYIAQEAVVRNVNFVYRSVNITGVEFGGIAKINDGTIENCKVVYNSITVSNTGKFSPLVTINRGTISHVYVNGGTVNGNVSPELERDIFFGNVCVYNLGKLNGAIVQGTYANLNSTDKLKNLKGESTNRAISAVRYNDIENGTSQAIAAILPENVHVADQTRGTELLSSEEVFNSDKIFYYFDFSNQDWKLTDGKLVLILSGEKE